MTGLVYAPSAEPELPVDRLDGRAEHQRVESGLLADLTEGRGPGLLARLDVSLRESPVAIRVADQEHQRAIAVAAEDDPPRGDLLSRRPATLHRGGDPTGGAGSSSARPSMNCRTIGSVECLISSTVPTCR